MIGNFPFIGVVENIKDDPLQINRIQVRLYGYHTENKQLLPTRLLRWFQCGINNEASISGVGKSGIGYVEGSSVYGVCFDKEMQHGIILCSYHGLLDKTPNFEQGFTDPNKEFPRYVNESDVNKLARGENTFEYEVDSEIDEPEDDYNAKYPYNRVFESRSGHIIEIDDTQDAERIRIIHKNGSFNEFRTDGGFVHHSKNRHIVIDENDNLHVKGDVKIIVDGNADITVKQDVQAKVEGSANITVNNETNLTSPTTNINGNVNIDGNVSITGNETIGGESTATEYTAGVIKLTQHKHPTAATGPASPPIP